MAFGGDIYNIKPNNKIKISRLVNKNNNGLFITSILLNVLILFLKEENILENSPLFMERIEAQLLY